jgi:light-regulated signal transduction histidine kinase (bacteriophytochrome)
MVASFTGLLARKYEGRLDPVADEYIRFAVDGAQRMQKLIEDLLQYSRIASQGSPPTPTSAGAALDRAALNLQQAVQDAGAVITRGPLPDLEADPGQLGLLFQNLLGNALKFRGPEPPAIHVSAVQEGERWHFSVKDNGIGIAPQHFDRIFEIFQRLHTRNAYPGTGIGLALCKRIVERHRGRIWVDSGPGRGTTFHFTLPAKGVLP